MQKFDFCTNIYWLITHKVNLLTLYWEYFLTWDLTDFHNSAKEHLQSLSYCCFMNETAITYITVIYIVVSYSCFMNTIPFGPTVFCNISLWVHIGSQLYLLFQLTLNPDITHVCMQNVAYHVSLNHCHFVFWGHISS